MELKYKTRGDSSPQGKPRVLFACHPEDHDLYFEDLSKRILSHQNCAIWYFDPKDLLKVAGDSVMEDVLFQLSEMQLFVFPVTTKLLVRESFARDRLIDFAEQNHIPILPIMMERSLEDVFALKFGDVQFLDVYNDDPITIPFDEKLESYLSRVLVGDELAERVRAAFDAYIFLSYRKKDRKYAQMLMRMIHSKPQYQNIAIWYDEYLVPGEDFNDAIKTALDKSAAFAMVVTPSLLENPNYVMEHEYPAARKSGKEIAAFEMNKTDRELLERFYEEIPECIKDADERESLFVEFLHKEALRETENDPMHNFLIGLAYLDGIDVEIDHEKALSLIIHAAESGESEAIEKLVEMYRNGKGVKRDDKTAIEWQKKYIEIKKKEVLEPFQQCINEIKKLGDYQLELDEYHDAWSTYRELDNYAKIFESFDKDVYEINKALSLECLGNASRLEGNEYSAESYYNKSHELLLGILNKTDSYGIRVKITECLLNLGIISQEKGDWKDAIKWFEKTLEMAQHLESLIATTETNQILAIVNLRLGDFYYSEDRYAEALSYYERALSIRKNLYYEKELKASYHELYSILIRIGNISIKQNKLLNAESWYKQALAISQEINEKRQTIESYCDLINVNDRIGDIYYGNGQYEDAYTWYNEAFNLCVLHNDEIPVGKKYFDASAFACEKMGDVCNACKKKDEAMKYYGLGLICSIPFVFQASHESCIRIANMFDKRGLLVQTLCDKEYAIGYYKYAIQIIKEEMNEKYRRTSEIYMYLSNFHNRLGDIYASDHLTDEATEYYRIGSKYEKISEQFKSLEDYIDSCYEEDGKRFIQIRLEDYEDMNN